MVETVNKSKRRASRRVYVTLKDARGVGRARGLTIRGMTLAQAEKLINRCVEREAAADEKGAA